MIILYGSDAIGMYCDIYLHGISFKWIYEEIWVCTLQRTFEISLTVKNLEIIPVIPLINMILHKTHVPDFWNLPSFVQNLQSNFTVWKPCENFKWDANKKFLWPLNPLLCLAIGLKVKVTLTSPLASVDLTTLTGYAGLFIYRTEI